MKTEQWINHFKQNENSWNEPDWRQLCELPAGAVKEALAASLAIFQRGETGEGKRVRELAQRAEHDDPKLQGYAEAVRRFINEEHGHAALLARMVQHLDGTVKSLDPSALAFAGIRKAVPLVDFEIQILLIAELIATAYYGLLARYAPDSLIRECCAKIVRDEVWHVAFHIDFFRYRHAAWLPVAVTLWHGQFQALYLAAEWFVWKTHGKALRGVGITQAAFYHRGRRACSDFLYRVRPRVVAGEISMPCDKVTEKSLA